MMFSEWLEEIENYSSREERLFHDFAGLSPWAYDTLMAWLESSYQVGYDHAMAKFMDDGK